MFCTRVYECPIANRAGHKSKRKNEVPWPTCSKEQENEVSEVFMVSLGSYRGERFHFKQGFKFSGSYSKIQPSKLTNHSVRT